MSNSKILFAGITLALFGALLATQLSKNFMMLDDYHICWRSEEHTNLDFSFYFVVVASATYLVNLILLCLSGQSFGCNYLGSDEKEVDNGMLLY